MVYCEALVRLPLVKSIARATLRLRVVGVVRGLCSQSGVDTVVSSIKNSGGTAIPHELFGKASQSKCARNSTIVLDQLSESAMRPSWLKTCSHRSQKISDSVGPFHFENILTDTLLVNDVPVRNPAFWFDVCHMGLLEEILVSRGRSCTADHRILGESRLQFLGHLSRGNMRGGSVFANLCQNRCVNTRKHSACHPRMDIGWFALLTLAPCIDAPVPDKA